MDMDNFAKKSVQLCTLTATLSILFLPVEAADVIPPMPSKKPVFINGELVPIPSSKPIYIAKGAYGESPHVKKVSETEFRKHGFSFKRLFSFSETNSETDEAYPHSYKPMSAKDSKLYTQIFEKQRLGDVESADELRQQISDDRLNGHVLYQRYLHPQYQSVPQNLKNWMDHYSSYPNAQAIYNLAKLKGVSDDLKTPETSRLLAQVREPTIQYAKKYRTSFERTAQQSEDVLEFRKTIKHLIKSGDTFQALTTFKIAPQRTVLDSVENDQIQTLIAQGLYYGGRIDSALKLAKNSADRSGQYVPNASWITGLSYWKKGEYADAAKYFEQVGSSPYASGWLSSAGYFWAARSYTKTGDEKSRHNALSNASKHSRTFYGLLASKALGQSIDFDWENPGYSADDEALILSHDAGQRAFLLVGAQQYDLAEAELMRLPYKKDKALQSAVLSYALRVGLPGVALRLGSRVKKSKGQYYDGALYPVSPWMPEGGYKLDPALIHAVIRQESRFDLNAKSYSGALGLMQLMPKTAEYIAQKNNYDIRLTTAKLKLPETNMQIGQDYLHYLLNGKYVNGDMVDVLVAYNAGPGNLLKWKRRMGGHDDPLLFIESIPVKETRDYVEHVLSNYWIYRHRAGLELPTLTALSNGKAARYAHVMQKEYPYKLATN